jgi:hypothetical protein
MCYRGRYTGGVHKKEGTVICHMVKATRYSCWRKKLFRHMGDGRFKHTPQPGRFGELRK